MERRTFFKTAAKAGAGLLILPSGVLSGANAPSNKLNIALIGVGGRGLSHFDAVAEENVVALCDVDERHLAQAAARFPKARRYVDWRKCLDQRDLDAVLCSTPDHTHAFIANWALNRDLHCYMEKPLGNTVEEIRVVRENYLRKKHRVCTQVGTQRHAQPNFNRVKELIRDGAIGTLQSASAWGNRQLRRDGYPAALGEPPSHLHYDLWIGPATWRPYNPEYFSGKPGLNCLNWNMYWDFGTGQVGDMGTHTMDLLWKAIDADLPTAVQAKGEPYNPEVTPVELEAHWEIPGNDWRPGIRVSWYQGGAMPRSPREWVDLNRIGHGVMFRGTRGFLIADFWSRLLIPFGNDADMSYYDRRAKEEMLPDLGHFQKEWTQACKGNLKTSADFDYNGRMSEMLLLGLAAYRAGENLSYDGASGKIVNLPQAHGLLGRQYRDGWTLDG
jgi:predicted dehydrogenase